MSREERSHSLYLPIRKANLLNGSALCLQSKSGCSRWKWVIFNGLADCFVNGVFEPLILFQKWHLAWSRALLQMSVPGSVVEPSSTFEIFAINWFEESCYNSSCRLNDDGIEIAIHNNFCKGKLISCQSHPPLSLHLCTLSQSRVYWWRFPACHDFI